MKTAFKNIVTENLLVGPETWEFWWDPRPDTQDPSSGWDPGLWRWNLKPENRDPTHRWDSGSRTRDSKGRNWHPEHLFYMKPKTWDSGHWKRDLGHTWQVRPKTENKHLLSKLGRKNYDPNELDQMSYK